MRFDPYLRLHTKTELKWTKDVNLSPKTVQFLRKTEKISLTLLLAVFYFLCLLVFVLFLYYAKCTGNKSKNRQMRFNLTKKVLDSKVNYLAKQTAS